MFPPFVGITYYRDWEPLATLIVMSCIVMHMFACIYCFFPLLSPVDPEATADATVIDYVDDDPPCLSN